MTTAARPDHGVQHVLIIPDGDRTYARAHGLSLDAAYEAAAHKLTEVMDWIHLDFGIPRLTLFACAEYNLRRQRNEVMPILRAGLGFLRSCLEQNLVRYSAIRVIGELDTVCELVPEYGPMLEAIRGSVRDQPCETNVLIGYSGEREVERAVGRLRSVAAGPTFDAILQATPIPQPIDVVIRTGGHAGMRLSGVFLGVAQASMYSIEGSFPALSRAALDVVLERHRTRSS